MIRGQAEFAGQSGQGVRVKDPGVGEGFHHRWRWGAVCGLGDLPPGLVDSGIRVGVVDQTPFHREPEDLGGVLVECRPLPQEFIGGA